MVGADNGASLCVAKQFGTVGGVQWWGRLDVVMSNYHRPQTVNWHGGGCPV